MPLTTDINKVEHHPEQIMQCGELAIATDSFGNQNNPPLVLIMGLATQMIHWHEDFCKLLAAQGFWVIRFDNRDMGKSSKLSGHVPPSIWQQMQYRYFKKPLDVPYTLDDMAHDVLALLDALGIDKTHVVGASMGGMIGQLLAIHHPNRVASLTCIMSTNGNKKLMDPKLGTLLKILKSPPKTREQHIEQALSMWQVLHGSHFAFPSEHFRRTIERAHERGFSASGVFRQMAAITVAPNRSELLKRLKLPVGIIHGEADSLLKVKNAYALKEDLPHAYFATFPGMGHTLPNELWDSMIEHIMKPIAQAH